ncbi:MAG: zinc ribbon domain-containing protein [Saccharofermentanales bacterium]
MRSIKPGRAPSMMSGVMSLAMVAFGIFWMIMVSSMGGGFFALFGIFFIIAAIAQAVYAFKNATSKNRYSTFDITDENEEIDPLNEKFGHSSPDDAEIPEQGSTESGSEDNRFCPYCGKSLQQDFEFCSKCGRKLPN